MLYSKIEGSGKPLNLAWISRYVRQLKTIGGQLAQNGFEVHLLIRNHGRSMQSLEFSYELMAQDLNEYCGHNLTSIDLLGHSMGGKTAMLLQLNILK
jgi:pimeloyl-ACP methyl ester carboxylesterase